MVKQDIKALNRPDLLDWLDAHNEKSFRADQILKWLYLRRADTFEAMTDLSKSFRALLETHFTIERLTLERTQTSNDGTRKYLFGLADGNTIESVLIPERNHHTICISSQVGCAQACRFCLTGESGFTRNLTSAEIVNQVLEVRKRIPDPDQLTNVVFMGMGEPLANYNALVQAIDVLTNSDWGMKLAARRITVSTAGIASRIVRLGEDTRVNIAVSLNAADDEQRTQLMPINHTYPISKLLEACRIFPLANGRKITFEYILFKDVNDSPTHAARLVKLLSFSKCKINLIPFNPYPGGLFQRPSQDRIEAFQSVLINKHFTSMVRYSKGQDILAACGQLRGQM